MNTKQKKAIVATQLRIGEDIYNDAKSEAERLNIPLNAVLVTMIDDGQKYRKLVARIFETSLLQAPVVADGLSKEELNL